MRMIGLIGGLSWESTVCYYQLLNRMARAQLGGLHSAPILLYSFEFSEIAALQEADDWQALDRRMEQAARSLNNAGAELLAIATNTMHRSADHVVAATGLELVHITDCTSQAILGKGHRRPLLLATRFTMEQDFYTGRMRGLGLDPQIPPDAARAELHRIIFQELCQGIVREESKQVVLAMIEAAERTQAIDCVIFGCTELTLLLKADECRLPVFDSTVLHAGAIIEKASLASLR